MMPDISVTFVGENLSARHFKNIPVWSHLSQNWTLAALSIILPNNKTSKN